ncbi:hypothetical protein [Microbulbifer hydrolyticus]|uniref:Uncharacterized protein n=1 Tax=Microbulbifer hydrolyticus TaxID=48074 RepID=A0A6P1T9N9_9GAMM|nr:hypothetical protein [Microbulbifer hydrolyticus]MBB5212908.1 hypothetical protein [Microbulbifer hydrolyticus]QHQ38306.1 hypothetical protein GTQ55_04405 [Microbulbifer hydrolyticus]
MSVGAWEPDNQASNDQSRTEIDRAVLQRIIDAVSEASGESNDIESAPDLKSFAQDLQSANWLAGLPATQWLEEAPNWNSTQVWALIRFFTLAEMQLQDWQGGAESPVIPLAKSLRQRKMPLQREQLLWIRQHSDNRYLPYGPL